MGTPCLEYTRRLEARRAERVRQDRLHLILSNARLAVFVAGLAMAWLVFESRLLAGGWLVLPAALFLGLVIAHSRVEEARERAGRAASHYERGLERLEHRWMGRGDGGERFGEPDHPYAADLDLFGKGSLFELLATDGTPAGAARLAAWLKSPADRETVLERQAAVEELRSRLDLREDLAVLGPQALDRVHPESLSRWAAAAPLLPAGPLRGAVVGLSAAAAAALLAWMGGLLETSFLLLVLLGEAAFAAFTRLRVSEVVEAVEAPGKEIGVLARVLGRLERERFSSPLLVKLRAALDTAGAPPSRRAAALGRLVRRLDWRRNMIFAPVAALLMWTAHLAFAIERWRAVAGPGIPRWLEVAGEIEALCALAGYAYENPGDPFPEISGERFAYRGEGLGHPLIPEAACVRNDVRLDGETRLLIVSGSNMSGKTTLLRTVGVNAVLALAGAPVRARRLVLSPVALGASIRILDSIQAGHSRFYAEILRIRRIVELTSGSLPVLFLLDEILHGTNSHDRRIGAEGVVKGLLVRQAAGLITTHDLALARIADELSPRAANVHFEDHLEGGKMVFDFRIRPGVVEKSNALALMRAVGLEV